MTKKEDDEEELRKKGKKAIPREFILIWWFGHSQFS